MGIGNCEKLNFSWRSHESPGNQKPTLIPGSVPTLIMPVKSVETPKPDERKPPVQRDPPPVPQRVYYYTLDDLRKHTTRLPPDWAFKEATHYLLDNGVKSVLSNRFCQDPLEAHFGRHRASATLSTCHHKSRANREPPGCLLTQTEPQSGRTGGVFGGQPWCVKRAVW
ncbi:hypothetical protein ACOMHN_013740 [Nucella lapillus]